MPKTKFQDFVFTLMMASLMVYGMVVYNIALSTGAVTNQTFIMALSELPIMVPIAFVLEFFSVGKIAPAIAFQVVRPTDRPQVITYAISTAICMMMCPLMSLFATLLFNENPSFGAYIQTWAMNFPVALMYQLFFCGPVIRALFRTIFRKSLQEDAAV